MLNLKTYNLFEDRKSSRKSGLTEEQIDFLDTFTSSGSWRVNPYTGLVDVLGDFDHSYSDSSDFLGVKFGEVSGYFSCNNSGFTSLEGAPQKVEGDFDCSGNKLTSLKGAPQRVGGAFWCNGNNLTSLVGAPQEVEGSFECSDNKLTSLKGAPQKVGEGFDCSFNELTSLKGAPQRVEGDFYCFINNLTSLKGSPQRVGGDFNCHDNNLTSLKGAPRKVEGDFYCDAFDTRDWGLKGWLKLLKSGGEGARLILTILPESEIDKWMKENPLDLDLLDGHPEIKKGVLARTGLRDTSSIARNMRRGTI